MSGVHLPTAAYEKKQVEYAAVPWRVYTKLETEWQECWSHDTSDIKLRAAVYRIENDDFIYSVFLMMLTEKEYDLNAGRFARFEKHDFDRWNIGVSIVFLQTNLEELIEWISDNTEQRWAIAIEPHNASMFVIHFLFEYHVDAVHCALRWR